MTKLQRRNRRKNMRRIENVTRQLWYYEGFGRRDDAPCGWLESHTDPLWGRMAALCRADRKAGAWARKRMIREIRWERLDFPGVSALPPYWEGRG